MFKDYLKFSRIERLGTIVLIIFIILFAFIPRLYAYLFPQANSIDYEKIAPLMAQWDSLRPDSDSVVIELFTFNPNTISRKDLLRLGLPQKVANNVIGFRTKVRKFSKKEDLKQVWDMTDSLYLSIEPYIDISQEREDEKIGFATSPKLFEFDPNTVTKEELIRLGLSPKVASGWVNYRSKGAKFYQKESIKKIWGLMDEDYQRLEPYIVIRKIYADGDIPKSYDQKTIRVDVNKATVDDFKQLSGIGDKLAAKIIRFREALGGFSSVKQVSETWGLPKETFYNLQPQFTISKDNIKQININTATAEILSKHPYLKWNHARAIVNYREQHGDYKSVRDLRQITIIDGVLFSQIEPYLTVE